MRGLDEHLSVGERVAWYRRRRGMSQEVLAGLTGRTVDWLSKIENGRAPLDRLSVISLLAEALDVSLADLIGSPQLVDWNADTRRHTVPALRRAVMSYAALTPLPNADAAKVDQAQLRAQVRDVWEAYQSARFGYVTHRVPAVLATAHAVCQEGGDSQRESQGQLALVYQAAASTLTKLGEGELAWICSDRGLQVAEECERVEVVASLARSVAHSLLSNGQYDDALTMLDRYLQRLAPDLPGAGPTYLAVYGSLFLVAAMAAARAEQAPEARRMLNRAEHAAERLGADGNHLWSAFGPTNVAIHRVSVAMETGDVQVAAELGPGLDVTAMPVERRIRHRLEVARALNATNRPDQGLTLVLDAEHDAPEQVRYHFLSRQLVLGWLRNARVAPTPELRGLAERLHVA